MVRTPELAAECFLIEGSAFSPETICAQLQNESLRAALELGAFFWRRRSQGITPPVLVVAAERDAAFPVREEELTARAYGAEFVLVGDQGHSLHVEWDWRQVAERIRGSFERIMTDK